MSELEKTTRREQSIYWKDAIFIETLLKNKHISKPLESLSKLYWTAVFVFVGRCAYRTAVYFPIQAVYFSICYKLQIHAL